MIRLLVDMTVRNKGAARTRDGLSAPLAEAVRERGWRLDFAVPAGAPAPAEGLVHWMPPQSDLVLEEFVVPRLLAGYDVVYTQRESLRLPGRRPLVVLQLHEHRHLRFDPWPTARSAVRGALSAYRASRMYRMADHICFSSDWTRREFLRLEAFAPRSSSVVPLSGWPDGSAYGAVAAPAAARAPRVVVVASNDRRDELEWALGVWRLAALPAPWELVVVGRQVPAEPGMRPVGWLSNEELARLLGSARGYLHVGRAEGFGLSVVEALQLGTPVLARPGSAVDELIQPGSGYLTGDVVAAVSGLRALAAGAVSADVARRAGERYTWSRTARAVLAGCDAALDTRNRARTGAGAAVAPRPAAFAERAEGATR